MKYYRLIKPLIFKLNEEYAHNFSIHALKYGLIPSQKSVTHPMLAQSLWGLNFTNPIGLAAGFDKNADVINPLTKQGFGFIETGTCTPHPQTGNPKPRLFRLKNDHAIINRMGFNNAGSQNYSKNLTHYKNSHPNSCCIIGANIGKNKHTANTPEDYITMMHSIYTLCDYITVNISSPNTPGLRALQQNDTLNTLLSAIMHTKAELQTASGINTPVLLKIAPDISSEEAIDIGTLALKHSINGLIISNTTIKKDMLHNISHANEQGGLSGAPLFEPSTNLLASIYQITQGKIPLIGAGGVSNAQQAYTKIRSGASLVQLYSALIYHGFELIPDINQKLIILLKQDGFNHISQAIGIDTKQ